MTTLRPLIRFGLLPPAMPWGRVGASLAPGIGRNIRCALGAAVVATIASAAPLTLDEAIVLALQKNQTLKVSAFAPDIARANVLAEYGRFDPALTFNRSYGEGDTPLSTTPLTHARVQSDQYAVPVGGLTPWGLAYSLNATAENQRGTFNRFTDNFITFGGVSVTQPLLRGFGFGANLSGLRVAKADRAIADWQHRQAVTDIVTNVVLTYNTVLQFRENVRIARLNRDLTAQLVDQNEKRNRIGQISDADVLQARARLAGREENVLFAERSAIDSENQLRQLIGETNYPPGGAAIELEPLPPATPLTIDPAADLKRAYEFRPDYQAARLGLTRRREASTVAQNQLLPRVDFVGSYGYTGMDRDFSAARRQVRERDVRAYSAGIVMTVPFTFAEGRGRARAAKLSVRQSEADLVRIEQEIALEISAAAGQIDTARRRVDAARRALDLAQRSLEAEQKKFQAGTTLQAGASSTFLVLQAQEQLAFAQNSHARALADQRRAVANYHRETGATLTVYNIRTE